MPNSMLRCFLLFLAISLTCGCGAYQPAKNVWKSTKGIWYDYISPPASVDYEEKGELPEDAKALSNSMMGIDLQLARLERIMQNADRPPTQQWLDQLFVRFPWLNGFAGVKNDGSILGQQPADSLKELDFNRLLYEDKKQNSRALRTDVLPTPQGPEIMLAAPLYDGVDFLGIVVAYFDMRSLMKYSNNAQDMVVLCPTALLWPGKYDYAATPLAGMDWQKVVRESSAGTCSNSHGSFIYVVRYLGNLPLVFATPRKGDFPEGNGSLEQGSAYFPQEREKLPPPPVQERKSRNMREINSFGQDEDAIEGLPETGETSPETAPEQPQPEGQRRSDSNEIQPGSKDSVLLRGGRGRQREIQERQLEGENIEVQKPRQERIRRPSRRQIIDQQLDQMLPDAESLAPSEESALPEPEGPTLRGGRPSPFGPREETAPEQTPQDARPSPFGPREETAPAQSLPGGRPSPFGPAPAGETGEKPAQAPADQAESPAPVEKPAEQPGAPAQAAPAPEAEQENSAPTLPGGRPSPFGPGH